VAKTCVDRGHSRATVDRALLDIAARVDPKPHEDRRPTGPAIQQVSRDVATAQDGGREMRRLDDAIVAAAARAIAATAAPGAIPSPAGAGARPAHVRCALRWRGALARGVAGDDLLHRRRFDPRLGSDDRSRFTPNILRCRSAFFFLR